MNTFSPQRILLPALLTLPLALGLAGCGAGAQDGPQSVPALETGADSPGLVDYCRIDTSRPGGGTDPRNGWVNGTEWLGGGDVNQAATLVSHDGSDTLWDTQVILRVPLFDARTMPAQSASPPQFSQTLAMGTTFATLLPKGALGCVTQLTKFRYTPPPNLNAVPGWANSGLELAWQPYSFSWKSYWDPVLPTGGLPGVPVDGFEFIANFTPRQGQAVFNLDKTRFATTQGLSVCFLAPGTATWDCGTPALSDLGTVWQLTRNGMKPGAYLLVATAQ